MKRMLMITTLLVGIMFAGTLISSAQATQEPSLQPADATGLPETRWKRGLAIAPVPLTIKGNKKLVGAGSYIVNTNCVDCHTNPTFAGGGNPFFGQPERVNAQNYLAGSAIFGPFKSANITPDAQGLPAGLTFDQFVQVMRTGKDFKNRHPQFGPLLQVMPWPAYAKFTDDDLEAIYAYLSAIPHADPAQ
jgi:hypothetical protein